jgi:hypothetical protein
MVVQTVAYSPTEIVFMVTSVVATITTMGVALITAWRTSAKVAAVGTAVAEVHQLTNRNFTEQKQEIAELRAQLAAAAQIATSAELARVVLADAAKIALADAARAVILEAEKQKQEQHLIQSPQRRDL